MVFSSRTEEGINGSLLGFRCSIYLQQLVTISPSCLPKPGHQTESLVRRVHLTMPIVNPVHDFQSYRWRNNEMRAFVEKSLPLENLAS